jgi:hypothetical protein
MTTSNRKPPLAAALAVMPLVACAGPPGAASAACPSDPYAGTRAADQALDTAQAANDTAMQARHGLDAGIDGMLGVARSLLTTVQTAERPAPPCPPRPKRATP